MSTPGRRPLAVVTGAARGIGAAIALALGRAGYDLALLDRRDGEAGELADQLAAAGAGAHRFGFELADCAGHPALVERIVTACGPVACLVNNAGIGAPQRGDLLELGTEAFDRVLDVNLRGTFFLTQAVARHLLATAPEGAERRAIVTVSSVSAGMASIERGEYCISKAGLGMLTRLFALRLAPHGIPVFEVRPGVIRTPMTEQVAGSYDRRIADGLVPMARWGTPEDVARAVCLLAAGDLAFATGTVVDVDGALSIPRL